MKRERIFECATVLKELEEYLDVEIERSHNMFTMALSVLSPETGFANGCLIQTRVVRGKLRELKATHMEHTCKYCGVKTTISDSECYNAPVPDEERLRQFHEACDRFYKSLTEQFRGIFSTTEVSSFEKTGRQIKFRVWDNIDFMSNPYDLSEIQFGKIQFTKDCVTMQFTGLTDKNGKEIYEGDILQTKDRLVQVIWHEHAATWDTFFIDFIAEKSTNEITNQHWCMAEVIGNIYENPELLK